MKTSEKTLIGTLVVQDTAFVGMSTYFELNFRPADVENPLQDVIPIVEPIVTRTSDVQLYACEYETGKINRAIANEMIQLTYLVTEALRNINIRKATLAYMVQMDLLDVTISCEAYQEPVQ